MAFSLRHVKVVQSALSQRTGQREDRVVEEHPAVMLLSGKGAFPVWLQDGQAWAENGQPLETLPSWFDEELAKCSPEILATVGWVAPSVPPAPVAASQTSGGKYCDVCELPVTAKHWGRHLRSKGHLALITQGVARGHDYTVV